MSNIAKTVKKLANGEHVTIVALGDSITKVTFHTRGRMNWVGLLDEAIFENYGNGLCTLINSGKCGSTYNESLTRIERDVLRYMPDLVIIALGMNDANKGLEKLNGFRDNVKKTISIIREYCNSEILICTPNPVVIVPELPLPANQEVGSVLELPNKPLKEYSAALVELAGKLNCACIDHYTLWTELSWEIKHPTADPCSLWLRMADAIHPGYIGHVAFFRELAPLFGVSKYFPWENIKI